MKAVSFLLAAGLASAQVASVGLKSESPHLVTESAHVPSRALAAAPVAGYMVANGGAEIQPLITTARSLKLGEALTVPGASARIYMPPRQQYALLEQASGEPVAVWSLRTKELVAIPGAYSHPDTVSFSPRGEASMLYSQAANGIEIITHLPAEPLLTRTLSVPPAFRTLAVSDDGALVVALLTDGRLLSSASGAAWTPLPTSFNVQALSFISKTHNLAISDGSQKLLVELSNVDSGSATTYRVVAQEVDADQLLTTRGGEQLVAANMARGKIWTIDLRSGALSQKQETGQISALLSLRDGYTFLLAGSDGLSLMKLAEVTH